MSTRPRGFQCDHRLRSEPERAPDLFHPASYFRPREYFCSLRDIVLPPTDLGLNRETGGAVARQSAFHTSASAGRRILGTVNAPFIYDGH